MSTEGGTAPVSRRLTQLYNAVLGANVALLPVLLVFLLREAVVSCESSKLPWPSSPATRLILTGGEEKTICYMPFELAVMLWVLTTGIVIHEWWLSVDFFEEYDVGKSLKTWQIMTNAAYLVPVLSLSALLLVERESVSLVPYAAAIAAVCAVDILIVLPIWSSSKYSDAERKRARNYFVVDIVALLGYCAFVFVPMFSGTTLFQSIVALGFWYLLTELFGNHALARVT